MLPLDKTFRIFQKSVWNGQRFARVPVTEEDALDRPSANPFENPWHALQPASGPIEAASPADIDLLRAAYFATFPEAH